MLCGNVKHQRSFPIVVRSGSLSLCGGFDDFDLVVGQTVEFVNELVDGGVGCIDLGFEDGFFVWGFGERVFCVMQSCCEHTCLFRFQPVEKPISSQFAYQNPR